MPPILVPSSAKRITTQIWVIAKLEGRKDFYFERFYLWYHSSQQSNWNTRISFENCSRLKMKTLEWCQWRRFVSLMLTMDIFQTCSNCWIWTGKRLLGSYWKDKHFWRQIDVYHALCCSILSVNKIY